MDKGQSASNASCRRREESRAKHTHMHKDTGTQTHTEVPSCRGNRLSICVVSDWSRNRSTVEKHNSVHAVYLFSLQLSN